MKQKENLHPYKKLQHSDSFGNKVVLDEGMNIVVFEKLDGANGSFQLEGENLSVFSRRTELDEENGLNGFYDWAHAQLDKSKIPNGIRIFGEWMIKHTISYSEDTYGNFFVFDALNMETQEYLTYDEVIELAEQIGLKMVPIFYRGLYQGPSHLNTFKGKSYYAENGEGLVVLIEEFNERLKMVTTEFKETHKPSRASKAADKMNEKEMIIYESKRFGNELLTPARIEKQIHKLMDEGKLGTEVSGKQVNEVFGNITMDVIEDAFEEELLYIEESYGRLIINTDWKMNVRSKAMGKVISIARKYIKIT